MKTIKIEGMHCSHCTARVENALKALGLTVSVNLESGTATVDGANIPEDAILRETVEDLGFDVISIE